MRVLLSSSGWSRGAAAVLLVASVASPLVAQGGGVGTIQVRPRTKDSVVVRVLDAAIRARLESLTVLSRALNDAAPMSPRAIELKTQMDAMWTAFRAATVAGEGFGPGGRGMTRIMIGTPDGMKQFEATRLFSGWIGFTAASSVPHNEMVRNDSYFIRYLTYPSIVSVEPNSPAQRAGIEPGDVLVAYDGSDVVAHEINLTQLFVPDRRLSVTVRRDGENRDYALTVEKAPPRIFMQRVENGEMVGVPLGGVVRFEGTRPAGGVGAGGTLGSVRASAAPVARGGTFDVVAAGPMLPGTAIFQSNGVFGASMMALKPELASVLKLEAGVIVDQVPEETPASRAGLKVGDIIVAVAGMAVSSTRDIRVVVNARSENRTIALQIIRDRKPKQLTVKW